MAARAGVEPTTLQFRVIDLSNAPPRIQSLGSRVLRAKGKSWHNRFLAFLRMYYQQQQQQQSLITRLTEAITPPHKGWGLSHWRVILEIWHRFVKGSLDAGNQIGDEGMSCDLPGSNCQTTWPVGCHWETSWWCLVLAHNYETLSKHRQHWALWYRNHSL